MAHGVQEINYLYIAVVFVLSMFFTFKCAIQILYATYAVYNQLTECYVSIQIGFTRYTLLIDLCL